MRYVLTLLTGNPILTLAILAWALAQIIKLLITLRAAGFWDWKNLLSSGGMPSSHSAAVCACAASIGWRYGLSSPLFAIAAIMAAVVMYDAAHVRRETGEQAKILNYMMDNWTGEADDILARDLKELIGHTPLQVAMGALLGIAVGLGGIWLMQ